MQHTAWGKREGESVPMIRESHSVMQRCGHGRHCRLSAAPESHWSSLCKVSGKANTIFRWRLVLCAELHFMWFIRNSSNVWISNLGCLKQVRSSLQRPPTTKMWYRIAEGSDIYSIPVERIKCFGMGSDGGAGIDMCRDRSTLADISGVCLSDHQSNLSLWHAQLQITTE